MKEEIRQKFCELIGKRECYLRSHEPPYHFPYRRSGGGVSDSGILRADTENPETVPGREDPFFILGNGSNLLVSDSGYRGAIIQNGP